MLYKKNSNRHLSDELFRSPTSEYRAAPFWAWNCKLEEDELLRQIEIFHEMGFGGFHMHVRTGMDTEYLVATSSTASQPLLHRQGEERKNARVAL